jgi:tRNA nucleotidyltransferase (CCA-adding enzyme)
MTPLSFDKASILQSLLSSSILLSRVKNALLPYGDLFVVGGALRDVVLGVPCHDIDLATVLAPTDVLSFLSVAGIKCIPTGIAHGTVTAVLERETIEISTFRTPGARSSFIPSKSIESDLGGRDFTCNALAWCLKKSQLIDPYDGLTSIRNRLLIAVGNPHERLEEDPLRILRMVRLASSHKLVVDASTHSAARELVSGLRVIAPERIRVEIVAMLLSESPRRAFELLLDLKALPLVFPEILPTVGCEQNEFHVADVFHHTFDVVERCPRDRETLRLAALFHDLGKPQTLSIGEDGRRHFYLHEKVSESICEEVLTRLRFSRRQTEEVKTLVALHMRPLSCGPVGVRRLLRELGELFPEWRILKWADQPPALSPEHFDQEAKRFDTLVEDERKRLTERGNLLEINGTDMLNMGIPEGPQIGRILRTLQEEVLINPSLNTRDSLTRRVVELKNKQKGEIAGLTAKNMKRPSVVKH